MQNITGSGACLTLANTLGEPDTFELPFEYSGTRRACRVVWRTEDELGVKLEYNAPAHETGERPLTPPL